MVVCQKGVKMGAIAEMMLDGTLCEGCGDFMNMDV